MAYIEFDTDILRQGSWFDLTWLQVPRDAEGEDVEEQLSDCVEEVSLAGAAHSHDFTSPGWPHGYADNLKCTWVFTTAPGTHLVLRILVMDLEETTGCFADSLSVYDGNALQPSNNAKLLEKLCLSNSTSTRVKASNVMTVKFETDSYLNKTGFSAYVFRDCGGKLGGPNGVIDINNSTTRDVLSWQYSCEWIIEVSLGER